MNNAGSILRPEISIVPDVVSVGANCKRGTVVPGRGGRLAVQAGGLEYRGPGGTDGEGGIDQADMGIGLRKVSQLSAGFGNEMF